MSTQTLTLDVDRAFHFAEQGINRVVYFSSIVLNSDNSIDVNNWHIHDGIGLVPQPTDNKEVLKEFKNFVSKSALREMMELFEQTLAALYEIFIIIENPPKTTDIISFFKQIDKKTEKFKWKRFPDKLKIIDSFLSNKLSKHKDFWEGLQDIRNCITHHVSIAKEEIKINIPKLNAFLKGDKTGKEISIPLGNIPDGISMDEEYSICVKLEYIEKIFEKGKLIEFTNEEIAFIIFGMQDSFRVLRDIVLKSVLNNNIPLSITSANLLVKNVEELENYQSTFDK